ncbi:hypothetical protein SVIO_111780 [Streptomyces violaceusniger]|uniref:Uncharacterized protein n=1 Tax=Streptomyces violaceusniger TaxID=68280 RepID=A0A4D4LHX8_STRVO|nr:hypothetical protein SVIO_111780 [Streptomyces violaceusniger]
MDTILHTIGHTRGVRVGLHYPIHPILENGPVSTGQPRGQQSDFPPTPPADEWVGERGGFVGNGAPLRSASWPRPAGMTSARPIAGRIRGRRWDRLLPNADPSATDGVQDGWTEPVDCSRGGAPGDCLGSVHG